MQRQRREGQEKGFTFIELMVSMVIASFVFAGIYGVYAIQQRSYTVQEQVSEMQQKGRAALDFMVRDIRMAGFDDPVTNCSSGNISIANPNELQFETCNAIGNQITVRYFLDDAYKSNGMNNGLSDDLFREENGGTAQLIAEGVDALEFNYFLENPTDPPVTTVTATDLEDIRSVQISMLIRAANPDRKYTDTNTYIPASDDANWNIIRSATNPPGDHYHRRLLITTVKLRNMGL